jgi:GAF domain-containing protein/HAMP domain-containing protein
MSLQRKRRGPITRTYTSSISLRLPVLVIGAILIVTIATATASSIISRLRLISVVEENLATLATLQAAQIERLLHQHASTMETLVTQENVQFQLRTVNQGYSFLSQEAIRTLHSDRESMWQTAYVAGGQQSDNLLIATVRTHILSRTELAPERESLRTNLGVRSEFVLADSYGAVIAASRVPPIYLWANEPWWQAVRTSGEVYISNKPAVDRLGLGLVAIEFAVPIYDEETQEFMGMLFSIYDYQLIKDVATQTQFGQTGRGGRAVLIDQHGEILYAPSSVGELNQYFVPLANVVSSLYQFPAPRGDTSIYIMTAVPISSQRETINQMGWYVGTVQDRTSALAPIDSAVLPAILIALAIGSLIVVLLYLLYIRPLALDLNRLRDSAEAIERGSLESQVAINRNDELGLLGHTFNNMAGQLRQTLSELEDRVAARTRALELSAQVGRRLSTILDRSQLISAVVEELQRAFNYYHVHIYLMEEASQKLMMAGGTGEAARTMLARGHSLAVGIGLVGRAAQLRSSVLVSSVKEDANWLPNPLLPETRAEVAVPIVLGDQVLGVLDVQHNIVNGLKSEDADLLQAIANQVANALRNAVTYEQAQRQAEREALINNISQRIQATTTIDNALQIAVRELGRAIGSEQTIIRLQDSDRNGDSPQVAVRNHSQENGDSRP